MKKLFTALRRGDLDTVKELIEKKPEPLSCTEKQPLTNNMASRRFRLRLCRQ